MIENYSAPIYPITSSDTYVLIEKVGNQINKRFDCFIPNTKVQKTLQKDCVIKNSGSVTFLSGDSPTINQDEEKIDRDRDVLDADISSGNSDTVHSGESLIKYYYFDASKFNSDTNKCIAFWKAISERKDLKPVESTLKISTFDFLSDSEKEEKEKSDDSTNTNFCITEEPEDIWYNTLLEMKKRKMDELAFATAEPRCKMCDPETGLDKFKIKRGKNYSEQDLKDDADIICLNSWTSKSIKKRRIRQFAGATEMHKRTKREDLFEIEKDNVEDVVSKCTCGKKQCTCGGTMGNETSKVTSPKNPEIEDVD